jgi:hypothetical protein
MIRAAFWIESPGDTVRGLAVITSRIFISSVPPVEMAFSR